MFKYIKTIGAHCAAPEISDYLLDGQHDLEAGSVMFHNSYGLTAVCIDSAQSDQKYLVLENFTYDPSKEGTQKVKAMPILPGMIFETDLTGIEGDVGCTFLLGYSNDGHSYDHVSNQEGHGARIARGPNLSKMSWVELAW